MTRTALLTPDDAPDPRRRVFREIIRGLERRFQAETIRVANAEVTLNDVRRRAGLPPVRPDAIPWWDLP